MAVHRWIKVGQYLPDDQEKLERGILRIGLSLPASFSAAVIKRLPKTQCWKCLHEGQSLTAHKRKKLSLDETSKGVVAFNLQCPFRHVLKLKDLLEFINNCITGKKELVGLGWDSIT